VLLDAPPLGPGIGVIMVTYIGEEQARAGLMHDHSDVAADAHGPEIRVLRLVDAMGCRPGRSGSVWRSKAVSLAYFCS
jgi:hypothetical protein